MTTLTQKLNLLNSAKKALFSLYCKVNNLTQYFSATHNATNVFMTYQIMLKRRNISIKALNNNEWLLTHLETKQTLIVTHSQLLKLNALQTILLHFNQNLS